MFRNFSLIALVVSASATKSLRATGQWGSDLDAEAATVSAGSDKWDTEDEADLDTKLLKPVYTDGDFFQQYGSTMGRVTDRITDAEFVLPNAYVC